MTEFRWLINLLFRCIIILSRYFWSQNLVSIISLIVVLSTSIPARDSPICKEKLWSELKNVLVNLSRQYFEYERGDTAAGIKIDALNDRFLEIMRNDFGYYRENREKCNEGFLSLAIYMSIMNFETEVTVEKQVGGEKADIMNTDKANDSEKSPWWTIVTDVARELNPLALKTISTWPFFGQLEKIGMTWDFDWQATQSLCGNNFCEPEYDYFVPVESFEAFKRRKQKRKLNEDHGNHWGKFQDRMEGKTERIEAEFRGEKEEKPLNKPLLTLKMPHQPTARISGLIGRVNSKHGGIDSSLDILRRLNEKFDIRKGAFKSSVGKQKVVIDVGAFDGSDWAKAIVEENLIGIGFEMVGRNRGLFKRDFPYMDQVEYLENWNWTSWGAEWCSSGIGENDDDEARRCQQNKNLMQKNIKSVGSPKRLYEMLAKREEKEIIERNEKEGFYHLIGAALGETNKTVTIVSKYDYTSLALQGYLKGPPDMEKDYCQVITLDSLFESGYIPQNVKIDVLKIDAEGYEFGVLRGAEKSLRDTRFHYVIFEYQPAMLATTGTDHEGILHFLAHYGFNCYSTKMPASETMSFQEFSAQYERKDRLKLEGMGAIEDIVCENRYWEP